MGTPAENLQAAVQALVLSNTLTLEAATYVEKLKSNVLAVTTENTALKETNAALEKRLQNALGENGVLVAKVAAIDAREAAVAKREAAVNALETAKAVAEAQSAAFRECFGLVFRNAEIREDVLKSPTPIAYHGSGGGVDRGGLGYGQDERQSTTTTRT